MERGLHGVLQVQGALVLQNVALARKKEVGLVPIPLRRTEVVIAPEIAGKP